MKRFPACPMVSGWLLAMLLACGGGGVPDEGDRTPVSDEGGSGTPEVPGDPGSGEETCLRCDVPPTDRGTAEDRIPEAGGTDGIVDPGEDGASPCPGGTGCPCRQGSDCYSGFCTQTREGSVCSRLCGLGVDCDPGWSCVPVSVGGESLYGCVDGHANLCRPCRTDADCLVSIQGNRVFRCLDRGPEGRFCGSFCSDEVPCPEGFDCLPVGQGDEDLRQCVPAGGGPCPCTPRYRQEGALTTCRVENEHGVCTAERTCDRPCPAQVPAPEICDGKDQDCDGLTDEDLDGRECPLVNPWGTCTGRTVCRAGVEECTGTPAAPEVCGNGLDEDCDGLTDEEGAAGCRDYFRDTDRDRFGRAGDLRCLCAPAAPYDATNDLDCDDEDPGVRPGAPERCNGRDDDCDGTTDEGTDGECFPYRCDVLAGACRSTCSGAADCQDPYTCDRGLCRKTPGQPCGSDAECAGGFCTDGVCCRTRCDGTCERCDTPLARGTCTPLPAGTDPDEECGAQDPETCGRTGVCSGVSACALWPEGTVCGPALCESATVARRESLCDGLGACVDRGTVNCSPFACDALTGMCRRTCVFDRDCEPGHACADGVCLRALGQECSGDAQCASGFCTDGVCCRERCDGTCEACNLAGSRGTCAPVPAGTDPADECAASDPGTCGLTGACSGLRFCEWWPAATPCGEPSCLLPGVSRRAPSCDGEGTCTDRGIEDCSPYVCDPASGRCRTACAEDDHCLPGHRCADGTCRRVEGSPCTASDQCASGHCVDGLCCDRPCDGVCEACHLPGSQGTCSPIPDGTDPDGECPDLPAATCGTVGTCSGQGTCRLHPAGTVCVPRVCASLHASFPADLCDGQGTCQDGGIVDCFPYLCDPTSGACRTSCTTSADCQAGYACSPSGVCLRASGQPCTSADQCLRGFCVDGVCCESRCDGVCESCALPGRMGFCDPIPAGEDPDEECVATDPATCGTTGTCSGQRTCLLWRAGTVCDPARCQDTTTAAPADLCDGAGVCRDSGTVPCGAFGCDPVLGACRTTCTVDEDCRSGHVCVNGSCRKDMGLPCTVDVECASEFCTDGVCCRTRCDGRCESCNQPLRAGHCDPIPAGTDPDGECPQDPVGSCGRNGECSGDRSCALHAAGTQCRDAVCVNDITSDPADACDGNGLCVDTPDVDCRPYTCDAATGLCRTACTGSGDCAPGFACAAGVCRKAIGQNCDGDEECASGFCADGLCCNGRCGGICERCDLPGSRGFCEPVPAGTDPDDECVMEASGTCGTNGLCSGSRTCALYAAGTTCRPSLCSGNTSILPDFCDGEGNCIDSGTQPCVPYACNPATGLCRTSCAVNQDCDVGHECVAGQCRRSRGQPCLADAECASGFCTDGFCCESRCGGTCEACSLSGREGFCDPVPVGTDPWNECPDQGPTSCGFTGLCSGNRTCALYPGGTVCVPAACIGDVSALADLCDGAGACVDRGTQVCLPYTCDPTTGLCRTSCSDAGDCQSGWSCVGGVCRKDAGQPCTTDSECSTGACCGNVCRDLSTDREHCGACGRVCEQVNGTNECVSGTCVPSCNAGFGDCDGNSSNGCEQPLNTLAHCGECNRVCDLPNASESCVNGSCVLGACWNGFGNCDGNPSNGCETNLSAASNTCSTSEYVGARCGDAACGFFCPASNWTNLATRTGIGSRWFSARIDECSGCIADVKARVTLTVPAGANYDLFVYRGCGSLWAQSTNGTGLVDQVTVSQGDDGLGGDSGFDIQVEVRFVSGTSCGSWTVAIDGTSC